MTMTNKRIQSPLIDASLNDLVYEDGDIVTDDTIMSSAVHQLALKYGSSPANPTGGCKVHNITKLLSVVPEQAKQYAREAVKEWTDDGRITDVTVDANRGGPRGSLYWEIGFKDASNERITITLPVGDATP